MRTLLYESGTVVTIERERMVKGYYEWVKESVVIMNDIYADDDYFLSHSARYKTEWITKG
jgi:hypothetical protein